MKQSYVYIYKDSNGTPLYVGKGVGTRLGEHFKPSAPLNEHVTKLLDFGKCFTIEVHPQPDEKTALTLEYYLVELIGQQTLGTGPLVNKHNSSGAKEHVKTFSCDWTGCKHSEEAKANMRASWAKRKASK